MRHKTERKALSWLLSFALTLGLIPGMTLTALAADNTNATTWAEIQTVFTSGGTVKLGADVKADNNDSGLIIPSGVTVTLDLNGHILDRGLTAAVAVSDGFVIKSEGTLTIQDSAPNTVHNDSYASLPKGGVITGGHNQGGDGGGVYNKGTFTMSGGSIYNNSSEGNGGGGVCNTGSSAKFTLTDGSIANNETAGEGGGVLNRDGGEFIMSGGSISGNRTTGSGSGGGVILINEMICLN